MGRLPVKPMGATIRMTKDRRILIRNTAEVHNISNVKFNLSKRTIVQKSVLKDFNCQMILSNQLGRYLKNKK